MHHYNVYYTNFTVSVPIDHFKMTLYFYFIVFAENYKEYGTNCDSMAAEIEDHIFIGFMSTCRMIYSYYLVCNFVLNHIGQHDAVVDSAVASPQEVPGQ